MSERTILIVDDEDEIRNLMSIYLNNEGYQVVDVPDAATAMDMLKKKIDLIILDVMMPGMNGIDTCLKIREEYTMPIIFYQLNQKIWIKFTVWPVEQKTMLQSPLTH